MYVKSQNYVTAINTIQVSVLAEISKIEHVVICV